MGLKTFIIKNSIRFILTLFFITIISFIFVKISPVDPATAYARRVFITSNEKIEVIREEMGLNKPFTSQYIDWVKGAVRGDFGKSLINAKDVYLEIKVASAYTIKIVVIAIFIQGFGAVIFALILFLNKENYISKLMNVLYVIGVSIPPFIIAGIILEILAVKFQLIRISKNTGISRYLPAAISLSINGIAYFGKILNDAIEREMNCNDSFYARTLGLTDFQILKKYTLVQATLSILPSFMQMMGMCFAGSIIVEQVFGLPGIGSLIINSVLLRDAPMIHGLVLFLGIVTSLFLLIADILKRIGSTNG